MKKEYSSPELELKWFSFEEIMGDVVDVSENESGGSGHNDDDDDDW